MHSTTHGYKLIADMPLAPAQKILETYLAKRSDLIDQNRHRKLDDFYRIAKLIGALDGTSLQTTYSSRFTGFSGFPWPLEYEASFKTFLQGEGISATILLQDPALESIAAVRRMLADMRRVRMAMLMLHATMDHNTPLFEMVRESTAPGDLFLDTGLLPSELLFHGRFFKKKPDGEFDFSAVDTTVVNEFAANRRGLKKSNRDWLAVRGWSLDDMVYIIDIEPPGTTLLSDAGGVLNSTFAALLQDAADKLHDAAPAILLGYYLWYPYRDPFRTYQATSSEVYKEWQARTDLIASVLEPYIDFWVPALWSVHTFCSDGQRCLTADGDVASDVDWPLTKAKWATFANAMISEAKRKGNVKPIIPLLGMYHHGWGNSQILANQAIKYDYMSWQLATIASNSDVSAIIFDDSDKWSFSLDNWYWALVDHVHDRRRRFLPIFNQTKAGTSASPCFVSEDGPDDTDLQIVSSDGRRVIDPNWSITYKIDGTTKTKAFHLHEGDNKILVEERDAFGHDVLIQTMVHYDVACVIAGSAC